MPLLETTYVLLPLFIMVLIGFTFGKFKQINLKVLAGIIIYISSPILAFILLAGQPIDLREISSIALSAVFVILGAGLISYFICKILKLQLPKGLYLPIMHMNSGFVGYPLVFFAFGDLGLSKAVIYNIINAILLFTVGIYIVSQEKDRWQFLKIPFIYASLAGMAVAWFGLKIPNLLHTPLDLIGKTTIPLALFMLGMRLAQTQIRSFKFPLLVSILRLGLGVGLGLLAVFLFGLQGMTAKIVILLSSLSSAATTIALAEEHHTDPDLVASSIALSTLISIFTIALLLNWLL